MSLYLILTIAVVGRDCHHYAHCKCVSQTVKLHQIFNTGMLDFNILTPTSSLQILTHANIPSWVMLYLSRHFSFLWHHLLGINLLWVFYFILFIYFFFWYRLLPPSMLHTYVENHMVHSAPRVTVELIPLQTSLFMLGSGG